MVKSFRIFDRAMISRVVYAAVVAGVLFGFFGTSAPRSQTTHSPENYGNNVRSATPPPLSARTPSQIKLISPSATAAMPQGLQPVYKTAGKDFFVAFPSCVGTDIPSDPPYKRLYISARSKTHGTVSLVGGGWTKSFITDPRKVTVVDLPTWAGLERDETELIYKRAFEIQSEDEVAVYALSSRHLSTDGFLVLPVEALGQQYSIASARNALYYSSKSYDTVPRSQCLLTGIEDRTTVTLTLTANSFARKFLQGQPYTFILNKGEVIEICARDTGIRGMVGNKLDWVGKLPLIDCDLTGSIITSDKPMAVFSGHERASVPDSLEFNWVAHPTVSRDHIIEQMPPAENWGKTFAFIPSSRGSTNSRPKAGDAVRIIAGYDLTNISINGVASFQLSRGSFKQLFFNKATVITSTQPVLIVKYLQTAALPDTLGDPDMTVLPPLENMSTFYSLPTLTGNGSFSEHYISILCDSEALATTTLNGFTIDPIILSPLIGTRYYYTTIRVAPGTQRIESTLPCYAEAYGFGNFNSYSFSGGGSFPYLHGLYTKDLDFGLVTVGSTHDSNTFIFCLPAPQQLSETSEVYHYTWESGDTNVFGVLDTLRLATPIASGEKLPVYFRFHPTTSGSYSAKLRVWSNNETDLFINVYGTAYVPSISISPDTLDFRRVRVGRLKDSLFTIFNTGAGNVIIITSDFNQFLKFTPFKTAPLATNIIKPAQPSPVDATFQPTQRIYYSTTFPVAAVDISPDKYVLFLGRGVDYIIPPVDTSFGKIRVGKKSAWYNIPVTNYGDDSTTITSIKFTGGNIIDFEIDPASLPTPIAPMNWLLDTLRTGLGNERKFFRARFTPQLDTARNIIDTGYRFVSVEIKTTDDRITLDTLRAISGEPILRATPVRIDFGTYTNPNINIDTRLDTLINIGTFEGIVYSLRQTNPKFFSVRGQLIPFPDNSTIAEQQQIPLAIDFHIIEVGEFFVTIFAFNDSRFQPLVIVHGKVKANVDSVVPLSLGNISSCLPLDTTFQLHNPSKVRIAISKIIRGGDTAGFSFPDFKSLNFPIFIDADSIFSLHLRYIFPADSLNGFQQVKIIIERPTFDELLSLEYDTIIVTLARNTKQLSLQALLPPYNPSAGDAPFSIPVYLKGDRLGITELDNDTIKIHFSNDLIEPIGLNRALSLTEEGAGKAPTQPPYVWDKEKHILSVPLYNVAISTGSTQSVLLFTILCATYLTPDTTINVKTSVGYVSAPCAFRVAQNLLTVNYANECGNTTLRDLLLNGKPAISVSQPHPNPSQSGNIIIDYISASDYLLSWQVCNDRGTMILSRSAYAITQGQGAVTVPASEIPASGSYYITITITDATGIGQKQITTKFSVIK